MVLIPLGHRRRCPDSVVLRPIHSVDGMTAQAVRMPADLLRTMADELLAIEGVCARVLRSDAQTARHDRVGIAISVAAAT